MKSHAARRLNLGLISIAVSCVMVAFPVEAGRRLYDMRVFRLAGEGPSSPVGTREFQTADHGPSRDGGSDGLGGILSELRLGVLKHDFGPFSSSEEHGVDVNFEFLFVAPGLLEAIWSPRPHIGATINTGGDTSQAYFGLTWEFELWRDLFVGFSFGGSVHDGEKTTNRTNKKKLGCRLLLRESVEIGWRFAGRHAVTAFLDHVSNANICDRNEGLENLGVRYGYRF